MNCTGAVRVLTSFKLSLALTVLLSALIGSVPAAADDFIRDSGSNVINSGLGIVGIGFREPGSVIVFNDGVGDSLRPEFALGLAGLNWDPDLGLPPDLSDSPATLDLAFGVAIGHGPGSGSLIRGLNRDGETVGISIGHGARGSFILSGGAVSHVGVSTNGGTVPAASFCCDNYVANAVGSAGQIVVRDADSNLTLFGTDGHGGNLVVGNGVFVDRIDPIPDFGKIGATTVATVEVLRGGELVADDLSIGPNFGDLGPMIATFSVSGIDFDTDPARPAMVDISGFVTVGGGFDAPLVETTAATLNVLDGGEMAVGGMAVGGTVGAVNVLGPGSLLDAGTLLTIANTHLLPDGATFTPSGDSRVALCQGTIAADTINVGVEGTLRNGGTVVESTVGETQVTNIDGELIIGCSLATVIFPGVLHLGATARVLMEVDATGASDQILANTLLVEDGATINVAVNENADLSGAVLQLLNVASPDPQAENPVTLEIATVGSQAPPVTIDVALNETSGELNLSFDEGGVPVLSSEIVVKIRAKDDDEFRVKFLSLNGFDARQIDPATIVLEVEGLSPGGGDDDDEGDQVSCRQKDVNGDGVIDLKCRVDAESFDLDDGFSGVVTVVAESFSGVILTGNDRVRVRDD